MEEGLLKFTDLYTKEREKKGGDENAKEIIPR
jgi:hypothetical protein